MFKRLYYLLLIGLFAAYLPVSVQAQCNWTFADAAIGACDDNGTNAPTTGDDFYPITVTLSYTNGDGDVTVNGVTATPPAPPNAVNMVFTANIPADGSSPNLVVQIGSGSGTCVINFGGPIGPLNPCSQSCDLTIDVIGYAGYNECQNIQDEFDAAGGFGGWPGFSGADDPCVWCSATSISVSNIPGSCNSGDFYESYVYGANAAIDPCNGPLDGDQIDDGDGMPLLPNYWDVPGADGCSPVYVTTIQSYRFDAADPCPCGGECIIGRAVNQQIFPPGLLGYQLFFTPGDCSTAPTVDVFPDFGVPIDPNVDTPCSIIIDSDFPGIPACGQSGNATINVQIVDSELQALSPITDICFDFVGIQVPYNCACCDQVFDFNVPDVCSGDMVDFFIEPGCSDGTPDPFGLALDLDFYLYFDGTGYQAPAAYDPLAPFGGVSNNFPLPDANLTLQGGVGGTWNGTICADLTSGDPVINTTCDPIIATFFVLPWDRDFDTDGDNTLGEYNSVEATACPWVRYDMTVWPGDFVAIETPGDCNNAATVSIQAGNGTECANDAAAGPVPPAAQCGTVNNVPFNYSFTPADLGLAAAPAACQQNINGQVAASCAGPPCACDAGEAVVATAAGCCGEAVNITNNTATYDPTLAANAPQEDYEMGYVFVPAGSPAPATQADIDAAPYVTQANADDGTDDGLTIGDACGGAPPVGCYDVYPFISVQELDYQGTIPLSSTNPDETGFSDNQSYQHDYTAESCLDNIAVNSSTFDITVTVNSFTNPGGPACDLQAIWVDWFKNGIYQGSTANAVGAVPFVVVLTEADFGGINSNDDLTVQIAPGTLATPPGACDPAGNLLDNNVYSIDYDITYDAVFDQPVFPDLGEGLCCSDIGDPTTVYLLPDIGANVTVACSAVPGEYEVMITPNGGAASLACYTGAAYDVSDGAATNITNAAGTWTLTYPVGTPYSITVANVDGGGAPIVSQNTANGCPEVFSGVSPFCACDAGEAVLAVAAGCCGEAVNITNITANYDATLAAGSPQEDYEIGYVFMPAGSPAPVTQADIDAAPYVTQANADDGTDDGLTIGDACGGAPPVGCYDVYPFISVQELDYQGTIPLSSTNPDETGFSPNQSYQHDYTAESCLDNIAVNSTTFDITVTVNSFTNPGGPACDLQTIWVDWFKNGVYQNSTANPVGAVPFVVVLTEADFGGINSNDDLTVQIAPGTLATPPGACDPATDLLNNNMYSIDYDITYDAVFDQPVFPDLGEGLCCSDIGEPTTVYLLPDIGANVNVGCNGVLDEYEVSVTPNGGAASLACYTGAAYSVTDVGATNITNAAGTWTLTYPAGTPYNITVANVDGGGAPIISQSTVNGCPQVFSGPPPAFPTVTPGGEFCAANGDLTHEFTVTGGNPNFTVTNMTGGAGFNPVLTPGVGTPQPSGTVFSLSLDAATPIGTVINFTIQDALGCLISYNYTTGIQCCLAEAGDITVNDICPPSTDEYDANPGGPFDPSTTTTITVNNYQDFNIYNEYVLIVDAAGIIQGILPVAVPGTSPASSFTGSGNVNIPYEDWPLYGGYGQNYTFYSYNEAQAPMPIPAPAVGMNIDAVGNVNPICFDLADTGEVYVPEPFAVLGGSINQYEGSQGGTTPEFYNLHHIEISGGTMPYSYEWSRLGLVRNAVEEFVTVDADQDGVSEIGAEIDILYSDYAIWYLTVTDANGCNSGILTFTNDPNVAGAANPGGPNQILDIYGHCATASSDYNVGDGILDIWIEGGSGNINGGIFNYVCTGPFGYMSSGVISGVGADPNGNTNIPYLQLTGLYSGWYTVTIEDDADGDGVYESQDGEQWTQRWIWVGSTGGAITCSNNFSQNNAANTNGCIRCKQVPVGTEFMQVSPNPFSQQTTIEFSVAKTDRVELAVYAADGRKLLDLYEGIAEEAYAHQFDFVGTGLPAGMYVVRLLGESGLVLHQKVMLTQ